FFSSRRRHTRSTRDWSSDVCSSDLRLAQALSIPRVFLPAAAGVTAAIGLLAAEVRFDVARTYVRRLDAVEPAQLGRMYAEMTRRSEERRGGKEARWPQTQQACNQKT